MLVDVPVVIVSKVGGGGILGWNYVSQHAGEGEFLSVSPINLINADRA